MPSAASTRLVHILRRRCLCPPVEQIAPPQLRLRSPPTREAPGDRGPSPVLPPAPADRRPSARVCLLHRPGNCSPRTEPPPPCEDRRRLLPDEVPAD
ncbi:hypothetical protein PAHAL_5G360200 [Panicum hallii]|uniref:Uncharacterized protein n=1 Tax=Panicum hallii TaxID=206008 RepID=A0A2S3HVE2_9POAL|nr:hypothetical protein PAHAL_5G360200 [Panicum hallii]